MPNTNSHTWWWCSSSSTLPATPIEHCLLYCWHLCSHSIMSDHDHVWVLWLLMFCSQELPQKVSCVVKFVYPLIHTWSSQVNMLSRLVFVWFHQMQQADHASLLTWTRTVRISLCVTICHCLRRFSLWTTKWRQLMTLYSQNLCWCSQTSCMLLAQMICGGWGAMSWCL